MLITSGQNVKPPFLRQYLIFFNTFYTLEIPFRSLLQPKNPNLKKMSISRYMVHTYIHTLLARPHGAFQSQIYITKL